LAELAGGGLLGGTPEFRSGVGTEEGANEGSGVFWKSSVNAPGAFLGGSTGKAFAAGLAGVLLNIAVNVPGAWSGGACGASFTSGSTARLGGAPPNIAVNEPTAGCAGSLSGDSSGAAKADGEVEDDFWIPKNARKPPDGVSASPGSGELDGVRGVSGVGGATEAGAAALKTAVKLSFCCAGASLDSIGFGGCRPKSELAGFPAGGPEKSWVNETPPSLAGWEFATG